MTKPHSCAKIEFKVETDPKNNLIKVLYTSLLLEQAFEFAEKAGVHVSVNGEDVGLNDFNYDINYENKTY